jgi:Flp pilus assembly protein TadB
MAIFKSSDPWTIIVIALSFGLFALALFVKGFTHDLLLEAGVFLVSVKLIVMAKKNAEAERRLEKHLTQLEELLRRGPEWVPKP